MIWRKRRDEINPFWKKPACILLCAAAVLFAGCAGKESAEEGISGEQETGNPGQQAAQAGAITPGGELFFNEYLPFVLKSPETDAVRDRTYGDIYGDRLYILSVYGASSPEAGDSRVYLMNVFDAETRQLDQRDFVLELPGLGDFYIDSMEAVGDEELSFRVKELTDMEGKGYLVKTDLEGKLLQEMKEFPDSASYSWNGDNMGQSMVFDTWGRTILCEWDIEEGSRLYWIDPENGGRRLLASLEGGDAVFPVPGDGRQHVLYWQRQTDPMGYESE